MSEPKDVLNQLAKMQEKPPRAARDLAVLEAARVKATEIRQANAVSLKPVERKGFRTWFTQPMWFGFGSLAAAVFSVFIVFGHQVEPESKSVQVAAAPAPVAAPVSAPAAAPIAPSAQAPAIPSETSADSAPKVASIPALPAVPESDEKAGRMQASAKRLEPPKRENAKESAQDSVRAKREGEVAFNELAKPAETVTSDQATRPPSLPPPVAARSDAMPSGRITAVVPAPAAAPTPAPAVAGVARTMEMVSKLRASDSCVLDIQELPLAKRNLKEEATKSLLEQCAESIPTSRWPVEIEWAKKLLEKPPEVLDKAIEKAK